ncbi:MAG TPA: DUF2723 domain-containing protein [Bacteroidales bacterium]|nr:DUF2723 domain-containing protein [Bacteroidales bacterium]HPS17604.1 DUF2723 domain-containing protein [Bacteroidales bacterium]
MKNYKLLNNIIGWAVFIAASAVYILTSEPTASFWDCGEYIATAYKLQVGHPPGAPMFQLMGRFFSLFAFNDVTLVARMVNTMSALVSGFTILFLFWSITMFSKKVILKSGEMTTAKMYAVFGSGIVGALAYTFSDSFWFSAVEGEVYATSSFFTAIVFWAILKWDENAEDRYSIKWVILIAYLMGLSIGVHLLNLLAIPAIVFVFYFRKKELSWKDFFIASGISLILLVLVMYVIIPQTVDLFAKSELLFVNTLGLPFNSGSVFFALLLVSIITVGLLYTGKPTSKLKIILIILAAIFEIIILSTSTSFVSFMGRAIVTGAIIAFFIKNKNRMQLANTIILCVTFLLIGYSTFLILIIRSNAKTPINENAPNNAIALLAYLNREQYGDWPLFYGPYYSAPRNPQSEWDDGSPVYARDDKAGKYVIIEDRKNAIPTYDKDYCTIFPRMWSSDGSLHHPESYKDWANVKGKATYTDPETGETTSIDKPNFIDNLAFFFKYQIGHMYLRYFMWNFVGRQNDIGNTDGNAIEGNWYSGIKFIDSRLGSQDNIPSNLVNKGMSRFYFLPLILGFLGFYYHLNKHTNDSLTVMFLFFMTGFAILVYLNQPPNQPRERDYAYAASFYAFAIWIGMGVLALFEWLSKKANPKIVAIAVTVVCFFSVPYVMAKEGWDNHDRSHRYTCVDFASDYLNSCAPNAILFTNGDNDTFPLWYAQEVEGIRTDVRVCNLSLLNTDWYIDQMKRKAYDSDPVPFALTHDRYKEGTLDYLYFIPNEQVPGYIDLKKLFDFIATDNPDAKFQSQIGPVDYFPTENFRIPVDSATVVNNGTVPKDKIDSIVPAIEWKIKEKGNYGVYKSNLMILDLLAHNDWKRPVYFVSTSSPNTYLGLNNYLQLEGLAYRLVPVKSKNTDGEIGFVNTSIMYDNLMNKFKWGNFNDTSLYFDETVLITARSLKTSFTRLADALSDEGKYDSAVKVLDKCEEIFPEKNLPYDYLECYVAQSYYKAKAFEKAKKITSYMIDLYEKNLKYYFSFKDSKLKAIDMHIQQALYVMQQLAFTTSEYKQDKLTTRSKDIFEKYYNIYKNK